MERAFEDQECIDVSLPCVYCNCSLVLKIENSSLPKAINVSSLTPALPPPPPHPRINVKPESTFSLGET